MGSYVYSISELLDLAHSPLVKTPAALKDLDTSIFKPVPVARDSHHPKRQRWNKKQQHWDQPEKREISQQPENVEALSSLSLEPKTTPKQPKVIDVWEGQISFKTDHGGSSRFSSLFGNSQAPKSAEPASLAPEPASSASASLFSPPAAQDGDCSGQVASASSKLLNSNDIAFFNSLLTKSQVPSSASSASQPSQPSQHHATPNITNPGTSSQHQFAGSPAGYHNSRFSKFDFGSPAQQSRGSPIPQSSNHSSNSLAGFPRSESGPFAPAPVHTLDHNGSNSQPQGYSPDLSGQAYPPPIPGQGAPGGPVPSGMSFPSHPNPHAAQLLQTLRNPGKSPQPPQGYPMQYGPPPGVPWHGPMT